ncbi:MAG: lipoate--protein ligase [Deltaproteobacteria bacterium]|nr:lipoate--protein ligase [Deltaproteobacteria bacterium]
MDQISYFETGTTWAPQNLATEEALSLAVSQGFPGGFMLWQNAPSVIIGRHQNAFSEVNIHELKTKRGNDLVRRMTGGGAVYHDLGNLNFSFILSLRDRPEPTNQAFLAPLIDYFKSLGLSVVMEGRNDLSIAKVGKFSGLAGRRFQNGWQLHGTIMYDVDMSVLEKVLLVDPAKFRGKGVASVRARVTNLKPHLSPSITLSDLWAGIQGAYGYPAKPLPYDIQRLALKLTEEKYGQDAWNIGQSPPADLLLKNRFPFGALELHLSVANNKIQAAKLTGDFLTPSDQTEQIPVDRLEAALLTLPADDRALWAKAWHDLNLKRAFYGQVDQTEIENWLKGD